MIDVDKPPIEPLQRTNVLQSTVSLINGRALPIMIALYCLVGLVFVVTGHFNRDEGWSLYAGRLAYEGKFLYRDFPYFQMPLLPYVYGLPQLLFGPSILVGRLTSFALSLVTVGVGVYLARRIAGRGAALLFIAFTIVNPNVMWTFTTTRTEPLVTPLVMLALFFMLKDRKSTSDLVLAPLFMLLAAAARFTVMPAFVAVLIFSLYQARKSSRQYDSVLAVVGAAFVLLVVIPVVFAGEKAVFNVWTSQEVRADQWTQDETPLGAFLRDKALIITPLTVSYPLAIVFTLGLAMFLVGLWRRGWRPSMSDSAGWPNAQLVMLCLALLVFLPHLALAFQSQYFVPSFAIIALMAATAVHRLSAALQPLAERMILPSIVGGLLLVEGMGFASTFPVRINTVNPDLFQQQDVADYLKSVVPRHDNIIAFDTALAFEADRDVAPGLEMAQFSFWPYMTTESARHYGLVNREILGELAADANSAAIVLTTLDVELLRAAISREESLQAGGRSAVDVIPGTTEYYKLAKTFRSYGQIREGLYIYLRKDLMPSGE